MSELNQTIKSFIESVTYLSRDVLHVYGGFVGYLLWLLLHKSKKQVQGLLLLLFLAVINEILDLHYYSNILDKINWQESSSDIFNTVFLPFLLFLFLRRKRIQKPI